MALPLSFKKQLDNAHWVCNKCGEKYGQHKVGIATWHTDKCDICKKTKAVTEFRDFGYSKFDTKKHYEI